MTVLDTNFLRDVDPSFSPLESDALDQGWLSSMIYWGMEYIERTINSYCILYSSKVKML